MQPIGTALRTIRSYLDDMLYSLVDLRLSFEVQQSPTGFPRFDPLKEKIEHLDLTHKSLHRLLRLGLPISDDDIRHAIPPKVLQAFKDAGVLSLNEEKSWQTDGCLLVPLDGLLLFVGIPPSYPTASSTCRPWFDLSTIVVARALPVSLEKERVVDVCSGSGVQSLLCAQRGAAAVVGLEIDPDAVEIARTNAVLNALDERVEFRISDGLGALKPDEKFDFVVCNTPYSPTISPSLRVSSSADVGNVVLMTLLETLPAHLSENAHGILALWRTVGFGEGAHHRHALAERLQRLNMTTQGFLDRAPDTLDNVMRIVRNDLTDLVDADEVSAIETSIRNVLAAATKRSGGFYNEVVTFRRGDTTSAPTGSLFGFGADLFDRAQ